MNRAGWLTMAGILLLLLTTGCTGWGGGDRPAHEPGAKGKKEWVVKWKRKEVDPAFLQSVKVLHRTENGGGVSMLVRLKDGIREEEWLDRWSSDGEVEFIHPNQRYKVEKQEKHTVGGREKGMYYLDRIRADKAWKEVSFKRKGSDDSVTVAVVDTGVDLEHPVLKPYLVKGVNLRDLSQPPVDKMGHGTHVAGVIAEVWKGWEKEGEHSRLRLMPVKVMSGGTDGDVYFTSEGIREAVRRGADVIVLAQGSWTYSDAMADAVTYAEERRVVVVGAAGNASISREGEILYNSPIYYPAAFPTVIGVGSVDPAGKVVLTSNLGPGMDVVAPGEEIQAATPGGNYGRESGTSFATPQVGALAALILRKYPDLSPAQVRNLIRQTARPEEGRRWNQRSGFGLIDVHAALTEKPLKDIHEPNDQGEEVMPFSLNQVYQGVLNGSEDRDCYQVEPPYPGMLTFLFKGNEKGLGKVTAEVTGAGKKVHYQGKEAGEIRLSVPHGPVTICYSTTGNRPWDYTLENRYRPKPDEYEDNDHQWNAYNIKVTPGYAVYRGTLHKKRDYDWYRLEIPEAGRLTLRGDIWSPRGDPVLFIQKEGSWNGKKVDKGAEGKAEEYRMKVQPGSVYVRVSDYGTNPIDDPYNLMVHFEPKNREALKTHQTSTQAAPLQSGVKKPGRVGGEGDQDWYVFFLPGKEKGSITFHIPEGAEGTTLLLYDENLRVIKEQLLSEKKKNREIFYKLDQGTYYLRIRGGEEDTGKSYELRMKTL